MTCHTAYKCDWCYGNSFIYNRYPEFCRNLVTCSHKIFCLCGDLIINFLVHSIQVTVNAVQKTDTHSNGTHIQIFLFDHLICFIYFKYI